MRFATGLLFLFAMLPPLSGCGGRFGLQEGQKQEPRGSDHYLQKSAERKIARQDDVPADAKVKVKKVSRRGSGWMADTVVEADGVQDHRQYIITDGGKISRKK